VAENARPPVAIRIVRPYETEEAFLENELETVGKTSVILIGAHSRPTGVILRFEVVLASGATVLRGEGRVLAHKESAFRGQPGLALRFTRLDPKSKALVDRAATVREARLAGDVSRSVAPPPPPSSGSSVSAPPRATSAHPSARPSTPSRAPVSMPPDPVLAQILTSPTPPPPAIERSPSARPPSARPPSARPPEPANEHEAQAPDEERPSTLVDEGEAEGSSEAEASAEASAEAEAPESSAPPSPRAVTSLPMPPMSSPPPSSPPSMAPPAASMAPSIPAPAENNEREARASTPPPSDRDSLLSRLRQRAASLTEEQMAAILRRQG